MVDDQVLNICFHGVGTPARELEPGEDQYWVSTECFYEILDEVSSWPAVRLSFDDGNTSDIAVGLPALLERGLMADFFVIAGRLNESGSLGEHDVRTLLASGMGIGTHGMRHRPWRRLDARAYSEEFVAARARLAEVVGAPVDAAACPLGEYDRRTLRGLRNLGYRTVFTSDRRPARSGQWLQPRYSVRRGDSAMTMRSDVLAPAGLVRKMRNSAVGLVKRWR